MSASVVRFSLGVRIQHVFVIVLFTALAVTGFPQKFYPTPWARVAVDLLGGIDRVRWVHRTAGLLFGVVLMVHVASVVTGALLRRAWLSMVPDGKDFRDAVTTLRFQLGLSASEARFDRYDYRQKFEYWGLLLGGTVMVATGLFLLAPTLVASVLSGQVIPAAKVAHSNEGLMAFLVVVTWHVFNAHLSPEAFPGDMSIFTGRISGERVRHEHPLEWARLREGRREPIRTGSPIRALVLAPVRGALLVMFLPLAGFALVGVALARGVARVLGRPRASKVVISTESEPPASQA